MNNFKKDLACNITLISVLACTVAHLLVLLLGIFDVIELKTAESFNYIVAFVLVIACLLLYILGFFITKQQNVTLPSWFRIMFYIAFFVFTNTYYLAGLYENIWFVLIFFAYVAVLINIICLSLFYNIQKDEKGRLKTSAKYLCVCVCFWSVAICAFLQFVITIFKAFAFESYVFSTLKVFVFEFLVMLVVCIIMAIIYYMSLIQTKSLINACLIKHNTNTKPNRSAK